MKNNNVTVMKLESELLLPATRANTCRLDALLADDFLEVGATGRSFGKPDILSRLPSETGVSFSTSDMRASVLADGVVLVTYAAERVHEGHFICSLRSSLWVKNTGGWQIWYHQGTVAA